MTTSRNVARPALVPELNITSLPASLAFWRDLLGFCVLYDRPEQGFAAIEREGVEFMLEEYDTGPQERRGIWNTGPREKPYGRGINFEITVRDVGVLLEALTRAHWPVFFGPEERWYRISPNEEVGVHQFLVQDPDGYLLRFSQPLGRRPSRTALA
jgi:catechol 2,3-dioxygenase-like lactoylglutathione lyase family enzyme